MEEGNPETSIHTIPIVKGKIPSTVHTVMLVSLKSLNLRNSPEWSISSESDYSYNPQSLTLLGGCRSRTQEIGLHPAFSPEPPMLAASPFSPM